MHPDTEDWVETLGTVIAAVAVIAAPFLILFIGAVFN